MVATTTDEPSKFAGAARRLEDHRLELAQDDGEVFHRLLRQLDAIDDEQHALGVARHEEPPDERGAEQRLAGAGRHLEQELALAVLIELRGDLIHRADLIAAQRQVGLKGADNPAR